MKRLMVCVLVIWFAFAYWGCAEKKSATSNQPTVDAPTEAPATPLQTPAPTYVVDEMDNGRTVGTLIGDRYYVLAYRGDLVIAVTNFRRVAATLEAKGWVMEPGSFKETYDDLFLITGTFMKGDKREESTAETTGAPPELILNR